jgi:hypothetical protein
MENYTQALTRVCDHADFEEITGDMMEGLPLTSNPKGSRWPVVPKDLLIKKIESTIEDFVFAKYVIDGKIFRRLVEPSIVSCAHAGAYYESPWVGD